MKVTARLVNLVNNMLVYPKRKRQRLVRIKFTNQLRQFFPELNDDEFKGNTVLDVLHNINDIHPGIVDFILDDSRKIRPHVNLFVNQKAIDRELGLNDDIEENSVIHIIQAVSGG
jgi:sulfur carrier protein ThiS